MIYIVDCALTSGHSDAEWDEWANSMKPPHILPTVPGVHSAQRFKGVNVDPPPYFALYSVDSLEVMQSDAYRNAGGGRFGTDRWMPVITYWNRDLFDGLDEAPAVEMDSLLLVLDREEPEQVPGNAGFTWLKCVGLDQSVRFRGLAVVKESELAGVPVDEIPGLRVMRPLWPQVRESEDKRPA